ncbi:MAG TPA: branched-chain amino acid ABC transporter permease [Clostridia bacterium]|jgi:branched-chain amino acid transport system permease protein|nr:branched-chain amino acid ABC transporter permease [Clostridia bacterium]
MRKQRLKLNLCVAAALVIFYFAVDFGIKQGMITPFQQINLVLIGVNIILAVSLNLITGFTGQLALGHAGFMAIGAYVAGVMTVKLGQPFLLALLAGACAAGFMGILLGAPTLRLKGDYLAIATLGFAEIVRGVLINIDYVGGAAGLIGIPQLCTWFWLFVWTVLTVVLIKNFINSTHGRACIAVRENEIAAEAMGVNTTLYKVMAFAIGAFFAGVAGAIYAHYFYVIQPNTFGLMKSFDVLVIAVFGGLGSITGSIIAAIFVTVATAALQDLSVLRMVIYASLLIIVMILRPQGLMGTKEATFDLFFRKRGESHGSAQSKQSV